MNILREETLSTLPVDLIDKAKIMSKTYEYLYCIENILRSFLETHPNRANFFIPGNIQKTIDQRKLDESKNKWIALRGNNDFFYIDFKDIGGIIANNWNFFEGNFPSQYWIIGKIEDLARCRNLIAHNSYLDKHELELIKATFNSILIQLQITPEIRLANTKKPDDKDLFVKGLHQPQVWTKAQAEDGSEYIFNFSPEIEVSPAYLKTFFYQSSIVFQICYENSIVNIYPKFEMGYLDDYNLKDNILFQIGMYDIDEDGIDELFICLCDNEGADNGIQINIFKYYPPAFAKHSWRTENWELIGNFHGQMILGDPIAYIEKASISIPRNLRGFYYEWTYIKNGFIETGFF